MRAQHFMSLNPVACAPGQSCAEAARLMRDRAVGCVVVLEDEQVVGLVTDRMLVTEGLAEGMDLRRTPVEDIMLHDVACVSPDATIFAVVDVLRGAPTSPAASPWSARGASCWASSASRTSPWSPRTSSTRSSRRRPSTA